MSHEHNADQFIRHLSTSLADLISQRDVLWMACQEAERVLSEREGDDRLLGIINAALSAVRGEREVGR